MFRAQQNAFDDVVVKATDENLTSENWEYILDVVDKVGSSDTGAKDAVAAMIKRLAHRNANVQLYTLELANALSQNCGLKIHKELASRSFTDALLRLAADRNTHQQVKAKILECMGEWTEMFSKDPDLGIMEQAYMRLKTQNPNLRPPSKPQKTQITDADRMKEEEELQMALALSVKDSKVPGSKSTPSPQAAASSSTEESAAPQPVPSGTTAATVSRVRALYDFQPSEPGELAFRKGDIIAVLESVYKDWWKGSLRGQTGIFPLNYVEKLQDPTKEELEREAQMEAEVFGQIRNVEKLLALLSTNSRTEDIRDNEEITQLYHSTLAIRPKLIELIGKYSQKKDDFTQLNEKFIKARRDYESLLESSMSHPPPPTTYGAPQRPYSYAPPSGASHPGNYPGYAPLQDPQRYFSPPPPETYQQYPPQNGPSAFYMVPPNQQAAGLSQAPPAQQPPRQSPKPAGDPYGKPPPAAAAAAAAAAGIPQGRPHALSVGQQSAVAPPQGRPHSVAFPHGGPQELATGQFDSPVENWHGQQGIPPQQTPSAPPGQAPYDPYSGPPPPVGQQQRPAQQPSYDSPTSLYSTDQVSYQQQQQRPPLQASQPPQPSQPPPGVPSSPQPSAPVPATAPAQGYQAYQPGQTVQGRWGSNGNVDESFYR